MYNHSTWDLEVYAREMQERRLREADTARQVAEARCAGDVRRQDSWFSISRFVSLAQSWIPARRISPRSPVNGVEVPTASGVEPTVKPVTRPNRLSQPYGGMAVLARGSGVRTPEQPCVVDC